MRRLAIVLLAACAAVAAGCRRAPSPSHAAEVRQLTDQGHDLDLAGKHDQAIAVFRRALALDPTSYEAQYGIGRALDLAGQYDEARRHFSAAIDRASNDQKNQALRMLGISWVFTGDVERAAPYFQQAFDRQLAAKSYGGAADIANELGRVYLELGRIDDAETWYRRGHDTAAQESGRPAWRVDLADMRWAHAQARIAARRGQAAEAARQETVVKRLLDKGGNDDQRIQLPYLLGYDAFYLGRYQAAIAQLEHADQEDPFILSLLAQSYEHLGDTARAQDYYRRVLASSSHAVAAAFARPLALAKLHTQ